VFQIEGQSEAEPRNSYVRAWSESTTSRPFKHPLRSRKAVRGDPGAAHGPRAADDFVTRTSGRNVQPSSFLPRIPDGLEWGRSKYVENPMGRPRRLFNPPGTKTGPASYS